MARKPRFGLAGVPQHVMQRGNNRGPYSFATENFRFYLDGVKQTADARESHRIGLMN